MCLFGPVYYYGLIPPPHVECDRNKRQLITDSETVYSSGLLTSHVSQILGVGITYQLWLSIVSCNG